MAEVHAELAVGHGNGDLHRSSLQNGNVGTAFPGRLLLSGSHTATRPRTNARMDGLERPSYDLSSTCTSPPAWDAAEVCKRPSTRRHSAADRLGRRAAGSLHHAARGDLGPGHLRVVRHAAQRLDAQRSGRFLQPAGHLRVQVGLVHRQQRRARPVAAPAGRSARSREAPRPSARRPSRPGSPRSARRSPGSRCPASRRRSPSPGPWTRRPAARPGAVASPASRSSPPPRRAWRGPSGRSGSRKRTTAPKPPAGNRSPPPRRNRSTRRTPRRPARRRGTSWRPARCPARRRRSRRNGTAPRTCRTPCSGRA